MYGCQNLNIIHWSVTFFPQSHSILKLFKAFTKCYIRCTSSSLIVKILSVSRISQMKKRNQLQTFSQEVDVEDLNIIISNRVDLARGAHHIWLKVKCSALQNKQKDFWFKNFESDGLRDWSIFWLDLKSVSMGKDKTTQFPNPASYALITIFRTWTFQIEFTLDVGFKVRHFSRENCGNKKVE